MEIRFYNAGTKEFIWTGDLGFPIPRIGETMFFEPEDGSAPPFRTPAVVVHVNYFVQPGLGRSRVDVFLMEKPQKSAADNLRERGLVV